MTKQRDMRKREQKQHLGTAANRDTYVKQGSVVVQDSKVKQDGQEEQAQKGETKDANAR